MGKLFVIEGLDGCGKTTQLEQLRLYFESHNLDSRFISFPDYEQPSSALVQQYLKGDFGQVGDVSVYAASSFYAVDRYASFKKFWKEDYESGRLIIADRYTTSNAIYQTTGLSAEQREEYFRWLEHYEYDLLGLPKPDLVCFLDMPVEVSQKMLSERYAGDNSKKDVHEKNVSFLHKCRETALFAAEKMGWKIIPCSENGLPMPIETITDCLLKEIKTML